MSQQGDAVGVDQNVIFQDKYGNINQFIRSQKCLYNRDADKTDICKYIKEFSDLLLVACLTENPNKDLRQDDQGEKDSGRDQKEKRYGVHSAVSGIPKYAGENHSRVEDIYNQPGKTGIIFLGDHMGFVAEIAG